MKTLIGLVLVLFVPVFPFFTQTEQDQSVPATVQDQSVPATEQEVTVPASAQNIQYVPVPMQSAQGITVTDIVAVAGGVVAFLGLVWLIVTRSEGRIDKKVDDAQKENKAAHDGIVTRLEKVDETMQEIRTDLGTIKGWIKGFSVPKDGNRNRSDDA